MSLYGKDDSNANVTKAGRGIAASSQAKTIVFVDETEAALKDNTSGINAPGYGHTIPIQIVQVQHATRQSI